jgi:hypothetical protein
MIFRALLLACCIPLLPACANDCQQLCAAIADYWADCEITHGDSEVADCRKAFRKGNKEEGADLSLFDQYQGACRHLTSTAENSDGEQEVALRVEFTCDDMRNGPGGAFSGPGTEEENGDDQAN